jgi:hypothetical protein
MILVSFEGQRREMTADHAASMARRWTLWLLTDDLAEPTAEKTLRDRGSERLLKNPSSLTLPKPPPPRAIDPFPKPRPNAQRSRGRTPGVSA